jgi:signal transduction histidine kinase
MSINDFLTLATQVTIVLIAALTLVDFLRHRDRSRLDIALLFVALAYIVAVQRINTLVAEPISWLSITTQIALLAHPFLLLRLVAHFRPISAAVYWLALGGMLLSWLILLITPLSLTTPETLLIVIYFVAVELYASLAFFLGGRRTAGVTRWRMWLAASGSGFIALVILLAGINAVASATRPTLSLFSQVSGLLSMLSYYAGFAPPRWLRRFWQLSELHRFLRQTTASEAQAGRTAALTRLCQAAVRAAGSVGAVVALGDETSEHLVVAATDAPRQLPPTLALGDGAPGRAWRQRRPAYAQEAADFGPGGNEFATALHAGALLVTPVATHDRLWGLLLVFNWQQPLFISDDLALLSLLSEQTAVALGYANLLEAQQLLIEQLHQRTTQLEAAYNELEAFSYSVSHDLRAPLRHIAGYVELLQRYTAGSLDEKSGRYIEVILQSARRMGALIDDLLAFSRYGRAELQKSEVDLDALVQDVIYDFQNETAAREIDWRIAPLPAVYGDRSLLRLALGNLIGNALKFTRGRSPAEIEIGCTTGDDEVICFVRDNGTGFDMRYVSQLFGVFQRLHSDKEFEGTGIGLANVRRIIQRHGGRTWAEGAVDKGATFYFSLPDELPQSPQ